jgi:hypothetical protein
MIRPNEPSVERFFLQIALEPNYEVRPQPLEVSIGAT